MARRRRCRQLTAGVLPDAVVLDSTALSGAGPGQVRVRAEPSLAKGPGAEVHVSSVTLTETLGARVRPLTGDPDALNALSADLANVTVVPVWRQVLTGLLGAGPLGAQSERVRVRVAVHANFLPT